MNEQAVLRALLRETLRAATAAAERAGLDGVTISTLDAHALLSILGAPDAYDDLDEEPE